MRRILIGLSIAVVGCKPDLKFSMTVTAEGTDVTAARQVVENARPQLEACYRNDDVKSALATDLPLDGTGKLKTWFWQHGAHDPPLRDPENCVRNALLKLPFSAGPDDTRTIHLAIVNATEADRKAGYGVNDLGSGGLQVGDPSHK